MRTDDFDYHLPPELIAQRPLPRGESRLLVLHREDGRIEHRRFADLPEYVRSGDVLVINDSRVTARRYQAVRESGGAAEALLLRKRGATDWEALVQPGKRIRIGSRLRLVVAPGRWSEALVVASTPEGGRVLRFESEAERDSLGDSGTTPLPPYIHERLDDEERYQTVYSAEGGSAAAPTAGLHFTLEMMAAIEELGAQFVKVTLHVGVDTFRPVKTEDVENHQMHGERYSVSEETAESIVNAAGRVIAVGTTSVRVLESAATDHRKIGAGSGETRLLITPGYRFKIVDALLTNFHLPKSTLLMLVSAFAGREKAMKAYREAVQEQYRFFSFGDAMLIV